jgi:hypothetical protein
MLSGLRLVLASVPRALLIGKRVGFVHILAALSRPFVLLTYVLPRKPVTLGWVWKFAHPFFKVGDQTSRL